MIRKAALSILIVNDQMLIRMGLRQLLTLEFREVFLGEAGTPEAALAKLEERHWNLVFLDMNHADAPEFTLFQQVRNIAPRTKIMVLAQHPESVYGPRALELGASGYLSQDCSRSAILTAVQTVTGGKLHFGEATRLAATHLKTAKRHHAKLSPQEYKVLLALASGKRSSQIAAGLKISSKTVSTYKSRLFNKLGISSIAEMLRYMAEHKLS